MFTLTRVPDNARPLRELSSQRILGGAGVPLVPLVTGALWLKVSPQARRHPVTHHPMCPCFFRGLDPSSSLIIDH